MYLKRNSVTTKIPIPRRGSKYLARTASNINDSVSVVTAVRDILKLAKTAKEVKEMIKSKLLKINGRDVKDYRESIKLFNIFEADKVYSLTILPTKRFTFEEVKEKNKRLCKVTGKRLIKKGTQQLSLHDGSNIISKDKIKVNDSIILDFSGKIISHIPFENAKEAFVFKGKYMGQVGKIKSVKDGKIELNLPEKENSVELNLNQVIVR